MMTSASNSSAEGMSYGFQNSTTPSVMPLFSAASASIPGCSCETCWNTRSFIFFLVLLLGDNAAVVEVDDALGHFCVRLFVRDHDDGLAPLVKLPENFHDALRRLIV